MNAELAYRPALPASGPVSFEWCRSQAGAATSYIEARAIGPNGLVAVVRTWSNFFPSLENAAREALMVLGLSDASEPWTFELPPVTSLGGVEIEAGAEEHHYLRAWTDGDRVGAAGSIGGVDVSLGWIAGHAVPGIELQETPIFD